MAICVFDNVIAS